MKTKSLILAAPVKTPADRPIDNGREDRSLL